MPVKKTLKISLIQSNLRHQDVEANLNNFNMLLSKIEDTEIILLPEMFNTSFSPKATHLAENMNGKTITWMKEVSQKKKCAVAGTLMIRENKKETSEQLKEKLILYNFIKIIVFRFN